MCMAISKYTDPKAENSETISCCYFKNFSWVGKVVWHPCYVVPTPIDYPACLLSRVRPSTFESLVRNDRSGFKPSGWVWTSNNDTLQLCLFGLVSKSWYEHMRSFICSFSLPKDEWYKHRRHSRFFLLLIQSQSTSHLSFHSFQYLFRLSGSHSLIPSYQNRRVHLFLVHSFYYFLELLSKRDSNSHLLSNH